MFYNKKKKNISSIHALPHLLFDAVCCFLLPAVVSAAGLSQICSQHPAVCSCLAVPLLWLLSCNVATQEHCRLQLVGG